MRRPKWTVGSGAVAAGRDITGTVITGPVVVQVMPAGSDTTPTAASGIARAGRTMILGAIPLQPTAFQPRRHLIDRLAGNETRSGVWTIIGSRGVGKTHLAGAVARARLAEEWRLVAWIDSRDMNTVRSQLNEVATALCAQTFDHAINVTGDDGAMALRHFLESDGDRCLLVFDNALDANALRPYLPAGGAAQVIVTSTNRAVGNLGHRVPVDVFTLSEAVTFLVEWTGQLDDIGANRVANALGCLPLALAQAAAVISRLTLSYDTYLARLNAVRISNYFPPVMGGDYPHGLAEAIMMSVDELIEADQAGRRLLDLIAILSPGGTRRGLLFRAGELGLLTGAPLAEMDVDELLGQLADASLITVGTGPQGDDGIVVMHGMVMRVVREASVHSGRLDRVAETAVHLLADRLLPMATAWTDRLGAGHLTMQIMALAEHLHPGASDDRISFYLFDEVLRLRGFAQWYLINLRTSYLHAIDFGEQLVRDAERRLGIDHHDTLTFRANLAASYRMCGRIEDAIPRLERCLSDSRRILGPAHRDTLIACNNLAESLWAAGDLERAISLLERNVAECESQLSVDHPDTLIVSNNLASIYEEAGNPEKALPRLMSTLTRREQALGAEHPDVLQSRNNLAGAYRAMGDLDRAIPMFESILADRERTLGADHPDTLTSRNNLAGAYRIAGEYDHAIRLLTHTRADCVRALGFDHPLTRIVYANEARAKAEASSMRERFALRRIMARWSK